MRGRAVFHALGAAMAGSAEWRRGADRVEPREVKRVRAGRLPTIGRFDRPRQGQCNGRLNGRDRRVGQEVEDAGRAIPGMVRWR